MTATRSVNTDIETVRRRIAQFEADVEGHPLLRMAKEGRMTPGAEKALGSYLFTDSWMWPPMLAAMRDQAKNAKLREAISDNLDDETGGRGQSHINMCVRFLKSIGQQPMLADLSELNRTVNISNDLTEAQISGWLAAAEMLTLPLYRIAMEALGKKPGADTKYLDVHMQVDEEHIAWLWAAVESLLEERACASEILEGVGLGARATLKSLDEIYEEAVSER